MSVAAFFEDQKLAISNLIVDVDGNGNWNCGIAAPSHLRRKHLHISTGGSRGDFLCSGKLSDIRKMTESAGLLSASPLRTATKRSGDVRSLATMASDYAAISGYGDFELIGVVDAEPFTWSNHGPKEKQHFPYFGSVTISGEHARRFSELLTLTGIELDGSEARSDSAERKHERVASWLPMFLAEHDRSIEPWHRSVANGRYYEVYDYRTGSLEPLASTLTTSISLSAFTGSHGATINSLQFHVYLGGTLSILVLNEPTWISAADGVELPYEAFSVYSVGQILDDDVMRPTSYELMARFLMSPNTTRFTLAGPRPSGDRRRSFYSSASRIFRVTPGDFSIVLELERETFDLSAERLKLNLSSRIQAIRRDSHLGNTDKKLLIETGVRG